MLLCNSLFRRRICFRDSRLAWIALVASICIHCTNMGLLWSFSLFYNALLTEYKDSKEKTAWIGSIPYALTFFLSPVTNWLASRLGTRLCIIIGTTFTGTALLATSFVNNLDVMFLSFSLLYGIGSSTLNMSTIRAIGSYFDKRLSTALGLLTGGTALLQIALTQLIIFLLANYGLQKTFQIYAAGSSVVCVLCSLAFFPTNYEVDKSDSDASFSSKYISLFKSKVFCLLTTAVTILSMELSVSTVHQVQVAIETGVPEKVAKQFPFYSAIGASIGRISAGPFLDLKRFDKLYVYQGLLLSAAMTCFIGSRSTTEAHLMAFIWIFSTVDGALQSALFPMIRILIGLEKLSEAISIILMLASITIMLGPPFVGFIVDQTRSYTAFFYVAGVPLVTGCCLLFGLRCLKEFRPSGFDSDNDIYNDNDNDYTKVASRDQIGVEPRTAGAVMLVTSV